MAAIAIAAISSGCSTTKNTATIELEQGKSVSYTIPVVLLGDAVSASKINSVYAKALGNATRYIAVSKDLNGISQGVRVTSSEMNTRVTYVKEGSGTLLNNFSADFVLNINRSGEIYTVKVTCPSVITNDVSTLTGMPWRAFIPKEDIIADVNAICNKAALTFPLTESGEINTSFNDSSVFSNFNRKFKSYIPKSEEIKQYDLEKSKWFYFSDNGKEHKVAISVFPYRNGSKVVYRSLRTVTCKSNQACEDFDPAFAERLKTALTTIAND